MKWMQSEFAKRIEERLAALNWTQNFLCSQLKIEDGTFSSWKKRNEPSLDDFYRLSEGMSVRPEWLVFGDEFEPMDDEELEIIEDWRKMNEAERHAFSATFHAIVQDREELLKKIGARTPGPKPSGSQLPPDLLKKLAGIADMLNLTSATMDPALPERARVEDAATQLSRLIAPQGSRSPKASKANPSPPVSVGARSAGTPGLPP